MKAVVKFIHAISSCHRDLDGPYPIQETDLLTAEKARAWVKKHTGILPPLRDARRQACGGWVFFPMRRGSIWWSISIRLDLETVQAEAAACTCRNHRYGGKP